MTALERSLDYTRQSLMHKPDLFLIGMIEEIGKASAWKTTELMVDEALQRAVSFGADPSIIQPESFHWVEARKEVEFLLLRETSRR